MNLIMYFKIKFIECVNTMYVNCLYTAGILRTAQLCVSYQILPLYVKGLAHQTKTDNTMNMWVFVDVTDHA